MGMNTPKAFANISPGFEHRENLGHDSNYDQTLKGFGSRQPFQGSRIFMFWSQGCRCAPTAGLKLANAFGVFIES